MNVRTPAIVTATVAVVAALLTASPAEARSYDAYVKTSRIAISSSGNGKVAIQCKATRECRGKISFARDTGKPRVRSYRVAAGRTSYVSVAIHSNAADNPHNAAPIPGREYKAVTNVRLKVDEDSPRNKTHHYNRITTETLMSRQQITGTVTGVGAHLASDVRVELLKTLKGGNTTVVKGQDVPANGGRYSLSVNLGTNNSGSNPYRLRIVGTDQDGQRRSWYWRGTDNRPTGGGAHYRDASVVRAYKGSNFDADFTYGSISGTTAPGAEVTVASPPRHFGGRTSQRELDIANCADYFGSTSADASGSYVVGFLPVTRSADNRYMVSTRNGSTLAYYGKTDRRYGSCHDATGYRKTRANLITLSGAITGKQLNAAASGNTVRVQARYSPAYKPTSQGDRWVRIREKVPGLKILDAPVVAEGQANRSGSKTFANLRPGTYWLEVGRRTGCSDWYPSKFSNNRTYFKGLDRLSENWKSFSTLGKLKGNTTSGYEGIARRVQPNPATGAEQGKLVKGYAGWMYRGYCKAYGVGTINTLKVSGTGQTQTATTTRNKQGAVVKGRVKRTGGRTNKEIMVTLSSSRGTRVIRTDLTDSSGTFYIAGLTSGNWKISVNADSWRGIGRSFSGKKSIRVKAGKGYNVGTLTFKS